MTYQETIDFLYSQLPAFRHLGKAAINPKLENTEKMCSLLGNPQNDYPSIHVAGTNGKGSSSHFLASILMESGYKVGLYTSPHLKDFRERFKINGIMMPENFIIEFVQDYYHEFQNLRPSFFELTVAMAFKYFSVEKVDVAIIEVGLGGRFDSTNIISKKDISLISNIGFDHVDILGNTLAKIAYEKAGIIKPDIPVVISEYNEETRAVFEQEAAKNHSEIIFAQDFYTFEEITEKKDSLSVSLNSRITGFHYAISSGLTGHYQLNNIRGVLAVCEKLTELGYNIFPDSIIRGFKKVIENTGLKGRWQILAKKPYIICDTGHNEHAFKITFKRLLDYNFKQLYLILGFSKDKDLSLLAELIPDNAIVYLCEFDSHRSRKGEDLKTIQFDKAKNIRYFSNVNLALAQAKKEAGKNDGIYIGGSTYLVAELDDL